MNPSFHESAKDGDLETVRNLILQGTDLNVGDKRYGQTPLSWAAEAGQSSVVGLLLAHGADIDVADSVSRKPLSWAARNGHKEIVQLLLANGDNVDSRDKNGNTPLSLAAKYGRLNVVELLIQCNSEIDSKDIDNQTPFSLAAMNGHLEVARLLFEKGADADWKETSNNQSPLSLAAENGYVEVVRWLLTVGCEIDSKSASGRTPLSWAAAGGHNEVVQELLAKGADANSKDDEGRTPLSYASEHGRISVVRSLLREKNIEYDSQDNYYDQTPLSWAAERGHHEIVSLLLAENAEADSRDRAGHTPLLWAIRNEHDKVINLLLEQDVEVIAKNEERWTPLSWAAANLGNGPLTRRLLSKAIELNLKVETSIGWGIEDALWRANEELLRVRGLPQETEEKHSAILKYEATVNLILENDEYLKIKDYKDRTLLSWAAGNGHNDVVKLLISRDLDPSSIDQLGRTPISWAAGGGFDSTVVILLDNNVPPDRGDYSGRTPLSYAAENGHEAVVKLLLDINGELISRPLDQPLDVKKKPAGLYIAPRSSSDNLESNDSPKPTSRESVDFDSQDNRGQTPLSLAAMKGHGKVVSLLLDKGANMEIKAGDNKSLWQRIDEEIQSIGPDKSKSSNLQEVQMLLESRREDGQLLTNPIEGKELVDSQFKATVVHFLLEGKTDMMCRRCSVLDLLKGKMNDEIAPGDVVTCKWLHVPANNMRWIEIIIAKHYESLGDRWKHNIVLKKELWTGLQHRAPAGLHHARFMRPTCQALPIHTSPHLDLSANASNFNQELGYVPKGLVLFMPYLHWEAEEDLNVMKGLIKLNETAKSNTGTTGKDIREGKGKDWLNTQQFLQAYLNDKHPLHIRRTLDQFYYHTLSNTDERDVDQTVLRYHTKFKLSTKRIVTMVDQLWLWVLPGFGNSPATVITSFPQRSGKVDLHGKLNEYRFTTLFSNIIAQTHERPIHNGYDLAEIISSECSRIYFDTMTDRDRSLQFLEIYTTSIGEITDKETECFRKFQKALDDNEITDDSLSISEEIKLLQEVKDIRDELNIMFSVFMAQRKALKDMARIMYSKHHANRRPRARGFSIASSDRRESDLSESMIFHQDHNVYPLPLSTVDSNISEITEMDKYAERAYTALNHLLDLKQKQANLLEAKATHNLTNQAIDQAKQTVKLTMATSSQGKMITFFTIITIIFMPLSFMAAFFAINIAEFPKDGDGNGLSLAYVSKYMFSISAAIIVPSIIIAFNLENIEKFLFPERFVPPQGPGPSAAGRPDSEDTPRGPESKKKQRMPDVERGVECPNGSIHTGGSGEMKKLYPSH